MHDVVLYATYIKDKFWLNNKINYDDLIAFNYTSVCETYRPVLMVY